MIGRRGRATWFAALRRDGRLFAAVGAILLFANMLQPLAEARAVETGKAWVICTVFGEPKPNGPDGGALPAAAADDCPICLAAAPNLDKAPPPAETVAAAAFPDPAQTARITWPRTNEAPRPPGPSQPPPAIRAPPAVA